MDNNSSTGQGIPCGDCKGFCCGPVPITKQEFLDIKKAIKQKPKQYWSDIKDQQRYFGTCIFYDLDGNKCGIYSARPSICKAFGNYKNLVCFKNPSAASDKNWIVKERPIGLLSTDFIWKDFLLP